MPPLEAQKLLNAFKGAGSASFQQLKERSGLNRTEAMVAVRRLEAEDWVVCSERRIEDHTLVFLLQPWAGREDKSSGGGEGGAG